MLVQSLKLSGIVVTFVAGVVGTVVLAQQAKNGGGESSPVSKPPAKAPSDQGVPSEQLRALTERMDDSVTDLADRLTDKKNRQIEKQLDLLIDAEFPTGVKLDQFLKHIKQETTNARPPGIPIYVNPLGLPDGEKTMSSTIVVDRKRTSVRDLPRARIEGQWPCVCRTERISHGRLADEHPRIPRPAD